MDADMQKKLVLLSVGVGTYHITHNNWAYTILGAGLAWFFLYPKDFQNTVTPREGTEEIGTYDRPFYGWPHPNKEHWHAPQHFSRRVPNWY